VPPSQFELGAGCDTRWGGTAGNILFGFMLAAPFLGALADGVILGLGADAGAAADGGTAAVSGSTAAGSTSVEAGLPEDLVGTPKVGWVGALARGDDLQSAGNTYFYEVVQPVVQNTFANQIFAHTGDIFVVVGIVVVIMQKLTGDG
jgi:hypothetical protein